MKKYRYRDTTGIFESKTAALADKSTTRKETIQQRSRSSLLASRIKKAAKDLAWVSESDEPINVFRGVRAAKVNQKEFARQVNVGKKIVEEKDFAEVFNNQMEISPEVKDRFAALGKLLVSSLTNIHVFAVGRINIDLYVVGIDCDGNLTGIKTMVVET